MERLAHNGWTRFAGIVKDILLNGCSTKCGSVCVDDDYLYTDFDRSVWTTNCMYNLTHTYGLHLPPYSGTRI